MTDTNPLYQPADVPAFAAIRPEHAAIIPQILDENRAAKTASPRRSRPSRTCTR